MTDARTAVSSVFGAVNETALTITTTVGAVSAGVAMLNNYIQKAKTQQEKRDAIEMGDFEMKLLEESTLETTRRKKEINKWLEANPESQAVYDETYTRYRKILDDLNKSKAGE